MSKCISLSAAFALLSGASAALANYEGVGRPATAAEINAWDIDVRADFQGLPKGSGTVAKGQVVWDSKCASCHGVFGESNEVFVPIVGGTTKDDIQSGRVAALKRSDIGRTTLMKLSTISTLWDYINRAMPWTAPKTLTVEEVYAVTAYVLHLGEIVPEEFTLSHQNMAVIQARLPNRKGMTLAHGLAEVTGKPDIKNDTCMKNCAVDPKVRSRLPDHARHAHGNLIAQDRIVGPARGAITIRPALVGRVGELREIVRTEAAATITDAKPLTSIPVGSDVDGMALAKRHACVACHAMDQKSVGPSIKEIAGRYNDQIGIETGLTAKLKAGGSGVWGDLAMPSQAHVDEADLKHLVQWILRGPK